MRVIYRNILVTSHLSYHIYVIINAYDLIILIKKLYLRINIFICQCSWLKDNTIELLL